jgi:hypothetical protein
VGATATGAAAGCSRRESAKARGAYVDVVPIDGARAVAVRSDASRSSVEMVDRAQGVRWRVETARYAGSPKRPGVVAPSPDAVHVRVVADGHTDLVTLRASDGKQLASLRLSKGWPPSPTGYALAHVMSVAGAGRSYQLVGDERRGAVVAVSPAGAATWRHPVAGRIDFAVEAGSYLALVVDGRLQLLDSATGATASEPAGEVKVAPNQAGTPYSLTSDLAALVAPGTDSHPSPLELLFDPGAGTLTSFDRASGRRLGSAAWPPGAPPPEPHQYKDGVLWIVGADGLTALDAHTLRMTAVRVQ